MSANPSEAKIKKIRECLSGALKSLESSSEGLSVKPGLLKFHLYLLESAINDGKDVEPKLHENKVFMAELEIANKNANDITEKQAIYNYGGLVTRINYLEKLLDQTISPEIAKDSQKTAKAQEERGENLRIINKIAEDFHALEKETLAAIEKEKKRPASKTDKESMLENRKIANSFLNKFQSSKKILEILMGNYKDLDKIFNVTKLKNDTVIPLEKSILGLKIQQLANDEAFLKKEVEEKLGKLGKLETFTEGQTLFNDLIKNITEVEEYQKLANLPASDVKFAEQVKNNLLNHYNKMLKDVSDYSIHIKQMRLKSQIQEFDKNLPLHIKNKHDCAELETRNLAADQAFKNMRSQLAFILRHSPVAGDKLKKDLGTGLVNLKEICISLEILKLKYAIELYKTEAKTQKNEKQLDALTDKYKETQGFFRKLEEYRVNPSSKLGQETSKNLKTTIEKGLETLKTLHHEIESLTMAKAPVTFAANANTVKEAAQPTPVQGTKPPSKPQNK